MRIGSAVAAALFVLMCATGCAPQAQSDGAGDPATEVAPGGVLAPAQDASDAAGAANSTIQEQQDTVDQLESGQ